MASREENRPSYWRNPLGAYVRDFGRLEKAAKVLMVLCIAVGVVLIPIGVIFRIDSAFGLGIAVFVMGVLEPPLYWYLHDVLNGEPV